METPRYRIDHIHYRVLDPEAAATFWREVFGATEKGRVENNGRLRVMFDLDGLAIFIEEVPAGTPGTPPPNFLGLEHLALTVTDIDAAVASLTARGATLAKPISSPRPGIRICFVNAPDGAQVELVERG